MNGQLSETLFILDRGPAPILCSFFRQIAKGAGMLGSLHRRRIREMLTGSRFTPVEARSAEDRPGPRFSPAHVGGDLESAGTAGPGQNIQPADAVCGSVRYPHAVNILQTVAVFVGGPLVIYVALALLSMLPGRARKRTRYEPGQPWDLPPQWWAGDNPVTPLDPALTGTGSEGGARGTW